MKKLYWEILFCIFSIIASGCLFNEPPILLNDWDSFIYRLDVFTSRLLGGLFIMFSFNLFKTRDKLPFKKHKILKIIAIFLLSIFIEQKIYSMIYTESGAKLVAAFYDKNENEQQESESVDTVNYEILDMNYYEQIYKGEATTITSDIVKEKYKDRYVQWTGFVKDIEKNEISLKFLDYPNVHCEFNSTNEELGKYKKMI